ncbi:DNA-binding protein RFX2-like [Periplaneta americana]|uniref:DNA-binding protein RFX2-like n=1 Tax=Periplaneta americana TaxID=6978 RepID=UPI0037E79ADC
MKLDSRLEGLGGARGEGWSHAAIGGCHTPVALRRRSHCVAERREMCSVRSSGPSRLQCLSRAAGNPEQWARPRNEMPSCQLADLGPVQGALTDINECVLHEGAQDEAGIHVESIHEEVAADSCARSFVPRRFGADASKESSPVEVSQQGNYGVLEATQQPRRDKVIPHSTPLTLNWLSENYELAEGVCIPRNVIYKHYCDFCQKNGMMPVNPASFGKIIRQKFKMVKNRRLGTRGYSTYHYYGIGIRTYSVYYDQQYSRNGINARPQSVEVAVSVDVHGSWTCNTYSCRMCGYSVSALAFHDDGPGSVCVECMMVK